MTDSSIKQKIQEDMKEAMRAKESTRLGTIRLLMAAIKQREVDERISLDDQEIMAVIDKMIKQRRESITQFEAAGRQELADQEKNEIALLQTYLPPALSEAEIDAMVKEAVTATQASSIKDMGKIMAILKPKVQGRADIAVVSHKIKSHLGSA
jgi:uncharacterized protein YqeY